MKTHPVAAALLLCKGWGDAEVYCGPLDREEWIHGVEHAVLMMDTRVINGELVVKCENSNGEDLRRKCYLYVMTNVMVTTIAADLKRK